MVFWLIIVTIAIMFGIAKLIDNDNIHKKICERNLKISNKKLWIIFFIYAILILGILLIGYKTENRYYFIAGLTFLLIPIILNFYCKKEKNSIFGIITVLIVIIISTLIQYTGTSLIQYLNTHKQLINWGIVIIIIGTIALLFLIYKASKIISKSKPENIIQDYLNYLMSSFLTISSAIIIVLIIIIYNLKRIDLLSENFDKLYQEVLTNTFNKAMLIYGIAMIVIIIYSIIIILKEKYSHKNTEKGNNLGLKNLNTQIKEKVRN